MLLICVFARISEEGNDTDSQRICNTIKSTAIFAFVLVAILVICYAFLNQTYIPTNRHVIDWSTVASSQAQFGLDAVLVVC